MNPFIIFSYLLVFFASLSAQAQVCQIAIPASAPDSRYQVNGSGTVTDLQTGLMWKLCEEGLTGISCTVGTAKIFTWQQALQQPSVTNTQGGFAGHADWRLPNVKELESLREVSCADPSINATVFPNEGSSNVWSSSPFGLDPGSTWYVNFNYGYSDGNNFSIGSRSNNNRVRLVRGGQ